MFRFTLVLTQAAAFSCERTISISRFRVSAAINKYQRLKHNVSTSNSLLRLLYANMQSVHVPEPAAITTDTEPRAPPNVHLCECVC